MEPYFLYDIQQKKIRKYEKKDVMSDLYYFLAEPPSKEQVKEHIKNYDDEITKFFNGDLIDERLNEIKDVISKIDDKIPLYDMYTENMYLIDAENVFNSVMYSFYRYIDKEMYAIINKKRKLIKKNLKIKTDDIIIIQRKYRKFNLMIQFLDYFNLNLLYETYIKVFYTHSEELGKMIILCQRPSFIPYFRHINPYYTESELKNLALNMDLKDYKMSELCSIVSENDISAKTLIDHQKYMIKRDRVGLIQYYSLKGSYIMNDYLRRLTSYAYQNKNLENLISQMWELILDAPEFDKHYIIYRFIRTDEHIRHLKESDIYTDEAFMSATRNPFYPTEKYSFGFILLKIRIPPQQKGVALCIETLSNFPNEQEILLPPNTMLRLDKRDSKCNYYHTNEKFSYELLRKYEFTYVGRKKIEFVYRPIYDKKEYPIEFLNIKKIKSKSLYDKINYFNNTYVNAMNNISVIMDNKEFILNCYPFNSSGSYKEFYSYATTNGYCIYSLYNNYMLFFLEIYIKNNTSYLYVNYYTRYTTQERHKIISNNAFVFLIASISYYFEIDNVIINADYMTCDIINDKEILMVETKTFSKKYIPTKNYTPIRNIENNIDKNVPLKKYELINFVTENISETDVVYGTSFCIDIYNYLKTKKKVKKMDIQELYPKFSYYQFDLLFITDPNVILKKDDRDELYQIYNKLYYTTQDSSKFNLADFYIWIIETRCYLLDIYISKINRLYITNNPFSLDYYIFDYNYYLYNKEYIDELPDYISNKNIIVEKQVELLERKNNENTKQKKISDMKVYDILSCTLKENIS